MLVENKKLTHDRFVQEGFKRLRPRAGCYDRHYSPGLAARIVKDLEVASGGIVVLKLCNRSRGAGVVTVPAEGLDEVLRRLLTVPGVGGGEGVAGDSAERELAELLAARRAKALSTTLADSFEEQCLHWWSNECPVFVAEQCCHSMPVPAADGSLESFDGTLRVVFALRQVGNVSFGDDAAGDVTRGAGFLDKQSNDIVEPFQVDWLGGYWKLPRLADARCQAKGSDGSLEAVLEETRARVVSSFNSVEKRTAEVSQEHLKEVCSVLTPALPRVFQAGALAVQSILTDYKSQPLLCAFVLARSAAAMRCTRMSKAQALLDLARGMVPQPAKGSGVVATVPVRAVLSYIERNKGVGYIMQQQWKEAAAALTVSLRQLPTNATAYYIQGCIHQEKRCNAEASDSMLLAIALDPDFKLPYVSLGNCWLHLGEHAEVVEVSRACLRRHPDSPAAQYNIGQALYQMVRARKAPEEELAEVLLQAKESLELAKRRLPDLWHASDEAMLTYLAADADRREDLAVQPVRTRQVFGWRP